MASDVADDVVDAVARARIADAVDDVSPQGELLAVQASLGLPVTVASEALVAKRGPGRPVGARNKRTESLAAQVERLFGNPVMRAAALASMPVDELAAALGCKPLEAVQEQRLWLAMMLPYVAARMPIAVDVTNHKVVSLTIVDGVPDGGTGDASEIVGVVEFQRVSDGADEPV